MAKYKETENVCSIHFIKKVSDFREQNFKGIGYTLSRCPKLDGFDLANFGIRNEGRFLKCEFYSNDILQDDVKEQWNSCMQNEAASKPIPLLPQLPNYSKAVQQKLRNFLLAKAFSEDCYSLMNFRW